MKIIDWAEEDRPREKMARIGAENLTNAELLAILIGSGSVNETAVDLMKRMLNDCGNSLKSLGRRSFNELMAYRGIGEARPLPSWQHANWANVGSKNKPKNDKT